MITFKVDNLKSMTAQLKDFSELLLKNSISEDDAFLTRLASCELLTNVIRHGGEAAEFSCELLPDKIAVTVTAECQKGISLAARLPDVFAESGRGLYIVNCIAINGILRGENGELKIYIKRTK